MKILAKVIGAMALAASYQATAITMDKAQAIVDGLQSGAQATEIRQFYRDDQIVYEIEYLYAGEEYEAIVTATGAVLENYKDTGAQGSGLPVIVSLAIAQETEIYLDQPQEVELIPVIVGNYGNFWFKGLRHGYSLYNRGAFTFSPMIKINPDYGYEVKNADDDSRLYEGLEDTDVTLEAGTQFLVDFNFINVELNLLTDVTSKHNGILVELGFSKAQHFGSLLVVPSLTFTYNDKKITNYYFGVADEFASPFRPAFDTGSSVDTELSTILIWNMSKRWYVVGELTYKMYDDKLEDSPLVDTTNQVEAFIGLGYSF